jgi:signal transduction histidine kinase
MRNVTKNRRRALLSWLFVAALVALCAVLGVLQYRWIGEVALAARERLRLNLQASLDRLSREFNAEITAPCTALVPSGLPLDEEVKEEDYAARYMRWKASARHDQLLRAVAIAVPQEFTLALRSLDLRTGVFGPAEWPPAWSALRDRLGARLVREPWENRAPPGLPPPPGDQGLLIELPRFARPPAGAPPPWPGRRELEWLIVELNLEYVQGVILPELLHRHLGSAGSLDYDVEVVTKADRPSLIYRSDGGEASRIGTAADASVSLFALQYDRSMARPGPGGPRDRGRGRGFRTDEGRWLLSVRHHAGSLDALVSRARWRNLAVTAAVLLLMLLTAAALIRYTRRAQRLAEMQMDFVAGVSHEFRTPLTVICTSAYNLRGRVANNPTQVERYGTLIRREGEKLAALVEQVLRFASARAGQAIREREPLSVEALIEDGVESSRALLEESQCAVETKIEPGLPLILGDAIALKHALQNLVSNAAKYGAETGNWIGIFASRSTDRNEPVVEIRVADRGPGIPPDEQEQIFDPFFRGRRAVQDQIHGTGLGLSLAKGIVEAHGGTIAVHSHPANGTEFVVRIPAAPPEHQDEFTHFDRRG